MICARIVRIFKLFEGAVFKSLSTNTLTHTPALNLKSNNNRGRLNDIEFIIHSSVLHLDDGIKMVCKLKFKRFYSLIHINLTVIRCADIHLNHVRM